MYYIIILFCHGALNPQIIATTIPHTFRYFAFVVSAGEYSASQLTPYPRKYPINKASLRVLAAPQPNLDPGAEMEGTAHLFNNVALDKLVNEGKSYFDVAESKLCHGDWITVPTEPLDDVDTREMRQGPKPKREEYDMPIHHVTDFVLLLKALRDAIKGHEEAYVNMNILHRDISIRNIFYAKDRRKGEAYGNLIDFDLSMKSDGTSNCHMTDFQTVFLVH
ncbi:hypothetical protein CVT24_010178 [Panaeolus cyanescens]|uniref:Fungal-type protein kinase domain-containing protein n=1 Tax=Panaeolus cyanescens TaxID=181874 RepID=A0A409X6U1_9AGAR|nr:hypothetical protein CVT24_010178 [Panaeolus cyanescens]